MVFVTLEWGHTNEEPIPLYKHHIPKKHLSPYMKALGVTYPIKKENNNPALCPSYRNVLRYVQILARWVRVLDAVRGLQPIGHQI